jgi:hypothetical protein
MKIVISQRAHIDMPEHARENRSIVIKGDNPLITLAQLPRIGDKVDMGFAPAPTVESVIWQHAQQVVTVIVN